MSSTSLDWATVAIAARIAVGYRSHGGKARAPALNSGCRQFRAHLTPGFNNIVSRLSAFAHASNTMSEQKSDPFLEHEYTRLCEEYQHFHQWATQANVAVRVEYNKNLEHLRDKKQDAGQRLKMLSEADEHLREHMTNAAERAIEAFRSALSDAKTRTANARSQPPFLY